MLEQNIRATYSNHTPFQSSVASSHRKYHFHNPNNSSPPRSYYDSDFHPRHPNSSLDLRSHTRPPTPLANLVVTDAEGSGCKEYECFSPPQHSRTHPPSTRCCPIQHNTERLFLPLSPEIPSMRRSTPTKKQKAEPSTGNLPRPPLHKKERGRRAGGGGMLEGDPSSPFPRNGRGPSAGAF